ncbi:hydrolase [Sphingomonas bacterium]|uniref:hydrolase n=1 Tax=Sphingomonas bacterium TaxID=1895847 RepID=UPI001575FE88|nr:hydrolase [Sphingomonas bacterium]
MPVFDPAATALVLIDLQQGIVAMDVAPRPSHQIVAGAKDMAARFREAGAPVVLVHVGFRNDAERPPRNVDQPMAIPPGGTPPQWMALVEGLHQDGDVVVLKHHWGAFTGTDIDLQLRRRGVKTIVLAGIATNMGVESTARSAWELGYDLVIVEDLCSGRSADLHAFAVTNIFPQLSRVVVAEDVAFEHA